MIKKRTKGGLTPKQKNLVALMPQVESGHMTLEAAMLKAGFAKSTSAQQSETMNRLRKNSVMQDALRKHGFTEDFLAKTIVGDMKLLRPGQARRQYAEMGAKLLDAFPSTKIDVTDTTAGYGDVETPPTAAKTPEEARKMAESSTR